MIESIQHDVYTHTAGQFFISLYNFFKFTYLVANPEKIRKYLKLRLCD